jgi:hypothetical protein
MAEGGLEATEVGKELAEHAKKAKEADERGEASGHDRVVSIIEAILLAIVALMAAWSGFSSAKWGTESRLKLAQASTARTQASREELTGQDNKNFDASTFNTWFIAYSAGNQSAMDLAARRFRPEFKVAFDAWLATDPANNTTSPPGPTYMPEYKQPEIGRANELDAESTELYQEGSDAGGYADDYVRTTVYLATVLFLVGISGHFRVASARVGLIAVGSAILIYAAVLLVLAPKPPG